MTKMAYCFSRCSRSAGEGFLIAVHQNLNYITILNAYLTAQTHHFPDKGSRVERIGEKNGIHLEAIKSSSHKVSHHTDARRLLIAAVPLMIFPVLRSTLLAARYDCRLMNWIIYHKRIECVAKH